MKNALLLELAATWELQAETSGDGLTELQPAARETLRSCADTLRMLVSTDSGEERDAEVRALLTSAHAIAIRRGAGTAWERFSESCSAIGIGAITARTYRVLPDDEGAATPAAVATNDKHLAFEWLRQLATAEGAPPEAGVAFDEWHRLATLRPVTQPWTHEISMMQQSVLLAAIRGPDGQPKYGGGAKMLLRWYRRCILLSAMDGRVLSDPIEPNGGSFTGPSLEPGDDDELDTWADRMQAHVNDYLRQVDMLPHHYQMHFMHAAEIVGYKHPVPQIRHFWHQLYLRLVNDFHLHPETEAELDERLGDTREGWLKRADPATAA